MKNKMNTMNKTNENSTEYILSLIYENNKKLPLLTNDVVNYIKTYTGEFKIRNGIYMKQIPRADYRYSMLKKKPLIKFYKNSITDNNKKGFVWWKVNNTYMIITVYSEKNKNPTINAPKIFHEYFYNKTRIVTEIK